MSEDKTLKARLRDQGLIEPSGEIIAGGIALLAAQERQAKLSEHQMKPCPICGKEVYVWGLVNRCANCVPQY